MSQQSHEVNAFAAALRGVGVVPVFQPIVHLPTGRTVAYEALARWPSFPDATPTQMFAAADAAGVVADLDTACRVAALRAGQAADLGGRAWLFVNAEPASLDTVARSSEASEAISQAQGESRLVLELTERSLLRHPSDLLRHVARARNAGWRIALDDLGAHPDSLALFDLLMPDVIKLDIALVQQAPSRDQARTLAAVLAHSERGNATILAEGIETRAHLDRAVACGATLGQGYLFGCPAALPASGGDAELLALPASALPTPDVPFDLAAGNPGLRTASKELLIAFSRHIETQADNHADPPVVLAALQKRQYFTGLTQRRYERLSAASPLVAVLGVGVPAMPGGAVRGADLAPDDPLAREWTVVALGAQTSAALLARDCGDDARDLERRFEFLITYDRDTVGRAARSLMSRLP